MSYSIRNYVKKNCTEKYTLEDMEDIATKVSIDSNGRYTDKSALKILCRYAYVQNNNIMFNVDARNSDQSIDDIKKVLNSQSKTVESKPKKTIKTQSADDGSDEEQPVQKAETQKTASKPVAKSTTSTTVKKGGFGNFSSLKSVVVDSDGEASPVKTKKTVKSKSDESDDDGTDSSSAKKVNSSIKSDTKLVKRSEPSKATTSKVEKKSESKLDNKSDNKSDASSDSKRNTSLFSSVSSGAGGKVSVSTGKSTTTAVTASSTKTSTAVATKTTPPQKKGGFGVFSRAVVHGKDDDTTVKTKVKKLPKDDGLDYKIPTEKSYQGVVRTEKKFGPYGTDNYHTSTLEDDKIGKTEQRRVDVYRDLASRYYPPQRSKEWFEMRDKMITASDGGTIVNVNPYEQDFGFVTKKVFGKPFETNLDCYHGKKYEQVATSVYEYRMNVKVKEFGLCRHPIYAFLGASPDGIVSEYKLRTKDGRTWDELEAEADLIEDPNDRREFIEQFAVRTKYVGRMLEIKCPLRRKILMAEDATEVYGVHGEKITDLKKDCKKGICPTYYWVQVQLQLQCCNLDECDFWQCEVFEYGDREDFMDDTDPEHPWLSRQTGHEKGAVIQLMPVNQINTPGMKYLDRIYNYASFIYQPRIDMTPAEIDAWIIKTVQNLKTTHKGMVFDSVKYWKLIATRSITIKRDDKWFQENIETFRRSWECVEYFRANKDKAKLLKRYINTFPLDCYKKVKEPPREKGIIWKTLTKIVDEPADDAPDKDHKAYAKFIATLQSEIKKSGVEDPKEYDVAEDIQYIKDALNVVPPDDMEDEEKEEHMKKFTEFVKLLKAHVDSYIYKENAEKDKDERVAVGDDDE
ncbi:YqaJ-like viral recombinase [Yasminevirus sp. GU-2018]|uniref:YqaJ-like viral recombinase n=1 Tax=Yasminevirus sp. GU-2018 TaxID=2420051 RepID=A0A5K0U839_9VIRU|nr:YqaJ-like viral recombinase [Yasminevirus sp. GU-2018]